MEIYVDERARDTYLSEGAHFAECVRTVNHEYANEHVETLLRLTIMVKMPAGYDPVVGVYRSNQCGR